MRKLKKMKEQFPLTSVSLQDNASVESWIIEENDGLYFKILECKFFTITENIFRQVRISELYNVFGTNLTLKEAEGAEIRLVWLYLIEVIGCTDGRAC